MAGCYVCGSPLSGKGERAGYPLWGCVACGLECLSPQPDDAVLGRIYGDHYFDIYGSGEVAAITKRTKRASYERFLREAGLLASGGRLLDCGAATGFLVELAQERGWDAYAIELSPAGAAACRRIVGADHVYEGKVEEAQFALNSFDVITLIDLLEHVRDPRAVLRWAHARLAPGGQLLITTPRAGGWSHRIMGKRWTYYCIEHLWYFSPHSLRALLQECGFSLRTIKTVCKTLTLQYIINCTLVYHYPFVTPLCRLLQRTLPQAAKDRLLLLPTGDMFVHGYV